MSALFCVTAPPSGVAPSKAAHGLPSMHVGFSGAFPAGSADAGSLSARGSTVSPRGILRTGRRASRSAGLQWDEKTIADHDLDRGTRMKIDEPKTPYNRSRSLDSGDAADMVDDEAAAFSPAASSVALECVSLFFV